MTVNRYWMPFLVISALLSAVIAAQAAGWWLVNGKQLVDVNQLTRGDEVRGWMTLEQLIQGYAIPQDDLYALLAIPGEIPPETALKDMEALVPNFEVSAVREAIDLYLQARNSATAEPDLPTPLPTSSLPPDVSQAHIPSGEATGSGPTPLPPGQILPGNEIKGRHTLQEIVEQCAVPAVDLLSALELPDETDMQVAVKDMLGKGKLTEIQVLRDIVSDLQAR